MVRDNGSHTTIRRGRGSHPLYFRDRAGDFSPATPAFPNSLFHERPFNAVIMTPEFPDILHSQGS
jgi:hypothetical protein